MGDVVGYVVLALGALISVFNLYLSWIRMPLRRALGQSPKWKSGFPFIGSLLLVVALFIFRDDRRLVLAAACLLVVDTGGPLWFLGGQLWRAFRSASAKRPQ